MVLTADSPTAKEMPLPSTSSWYLEPGLPHSVGFGPVRQPPLGPHAQRVQASSRPVELALPAELVQQLVAELLPHRRAASPAAAASR
jgi:hypothetical protein